MLLVDTFRKFRKKSRFWGKNTSTKFQKFWDTSIKVGWTPPKYPWYQLGWSWKGRSSSIRVRSKLLKGGVVRSWQVQNWSWSIQVGSRLVRDGQITSGSNRSYWGVVTITPDRVGVSHAWPELIRVRYELVSGGQVSYFRLKAGWEWLRLLG